MTEGYRPGSAQSSEPAVAADGAGISAFRDMKSQPPAPLLNFRVRPVLMPADLSVPRIDDWFWDALESSRHSLRALCGRLEALPRERLYAFLYQYWEAMDYAPPGGRPPTVPVPADFDDEDFAAWVVSQGRAFYYDLRRHPERLQAYIGMYVASEEDLAFPELRWDERVDREEYRGRQSPFQVGLVIYRARFGKDIWRLIVGHDWDPDLPEPSG